MTIFGIPSPACRAFIAASHYLMLKLKRLFLWGAFEIGGVQISHYVHGALLPTLHACNIGRQLIRERSRGSTCGLAETTRISFCMLSKEVSSICAFFATFCRKSSLFLVKDFLEE